MDDDAGGGSGAIDDGGPLKLSFTVSGTIPRFPVRDIAEVLWELDALGFIMGEPAEVGLVPPSVPWDPHVLDASNWEEEPPCTLIGCCCCCCCCCC